MSLRLYLGLPSPKKWPVQDSKEKNKIYDQSKRRRTIVPSWKSEFSWLICDDSHGKIFCQPCRAVYGPLAVRSVPERFKRYAKGTLSWDVGSHVDTLSEFRINPYLLLILKAYGRCSKCQSYILWFDPT